MYMVQIEIEGGPACLFPTSTNEYAAAAVWQFMVDNLKPGLRVLLMDESGRVVTAAESGDTKKLMGRW